MAVVVWENERGGVVPRWALLAYIAGVRTSTPPFTEDRMRPSVLAGFGPRPVRCVTVRETGTALGALALRRDLGAFKWDGRPTVE
jgi:hypothetical protein